MHLDNGLAAPCMGGGAWVGARCWLGGRGRGLFTWTCDVIYNGPLANPTSLKTHIFKVDSRKNGKTFLYKTNSMILVSTFFN